MNKEVAITVKEPKKVLIKRTEMDNFIDISPSLKNAIQRMHDILSDYFYYNDSQLKLKEKFQKENKYFEWLSNDEINVLFSNQEI